MEIGEGVAAAAAAQEKGRCAFCGNAHDAPRREEIKPAAGTEGWTRVSMSDVRRPGLDALYPSGAAVGYHHEGHHCIALSAWCIGLGGKNPRDFILTLNHYLKRWEYSPNRPENCIQLPGRGARPSAKGDEAATYRAFWESVASGKPLQMHVTFHESGQSLASKRMIRDIAMFFKAHPGLCEESDDASLREKVLALTAQAENRALRCCARYEAPFRLHPSRLRFACEAFLASDGERCADPKPVALSRPWVRGFMSDEVRATAALAAGLGPEDATLLQERVIDAMGRIELGLDEGPFGGGGAPRR